jgi:two-component system, NarL family, response regulator NreC
MVKLRILLVDDHTVLREGLKLLIESQPDMEVVGQASDGREAVRQVKLCQPDVIVMDVSMPGLGGAEATEQIRQQCPQACVLALTRYGDQGYLRRLLRAGAAGYVVKKAAADELINAVRIVAAGRTYIDPSLAGPLVHGLIGRSASDKSARPPGELTGREQEVLRLIAWGQSNKEIAAQLGISVKTVEYHKARSTEKLHLRSRTDMLRYALAQGWLEEEQSPE